MFWHLCVFQEQDLGRRMDFSKGRNGLYYLEPSQESKANQPISLFSVSNKDTLWLYHCCLGHPSFSVLKIIFPHLFEI